MITKKIATGLLCATVFIGTSAVQAKEYIIDTKGAHAFIQFQIKHLGFSWLSGRFNTFEGRFYYDEASPNSSSVEVSIDVASIDSMHAERDKHLRDIKYLDVKQFPTAKFVSTSFTENDDGTAIMVGDFTLRGITKSIMIDVEKIGSGPSPWGKGEHVGFRGTTELMLEDFGMHSMGPGADKVYLTLDIEGISS